MYFIISYSRYSVNILILITTNSLINTHYFYLSFLTLWTNISFVFLHQLYTHGSKTTHVYSLWNIMGTSDIWNIFTADNYSHATHLTTQHGCFCTSDTWKKSQGCQFIWDSLAGIVEMGFWVVFAVGGSYATLQRVIKDLFFLFL